jgi:hypothetical protein
MMDDWEEKLGEGSNMLILAITSMKEMPNPSYTSSSSEIKTCFEEISFEAL